MNIRRWFGIEDYNSSSKIDYCIDELYELYAKSLTGYFSITKANNAHELLEQINMSDLRPSQRNFVDWLKDKGFPYLYDLGSVNLPDDDQLISQVEYQIYILEQDIDLEHPDDLRSSLVGVVNILPELIKAAQEVSSTIEDSEYKDYFQVINKNENYDFENSMDYSFSRQENNYSSENYKESASKAGSFLFA